MDVSRTKICLDTSILESINMNRREYIIHVKHLNIVPKYIYSKVFDVEIWALLKLRFSFWHKLIMTTTR
jgi:hypothetical protein